MGNSAVSKSRRHLDELQSGTSLVSQRRYQSVQRDRSDAEESGISTSPSCNHSSSYSPTRDLLTAEPAVCITYVVIRFNLVSHVTCSCCFAIDLIFITVQSHVWKGGSEPGLAVQGDRLVKRLNRSPKRPPGDFLIIYSPAMLSDFWSVDATLGQFSLCHHFIIEKQTSAGMDNTKTS